MAAAIAFAGCSERPQAAGLRFGLAAGPVTLDPRYTTDAAGDRVNRLLYARLVDFDDRFRPVPALARWERLSPTRYRFRLGDRGRRFHDGQRLDANDVAATYEAVLAAGSGSPHRGSLAHVAAIEVLDDDSLEFVLARPDPLFPGRLVLGILPAGAIARDHPFGREPIGSGPFALRAWPEEGRLVLERRADGVTVELLRVADPTVRALKLLRGEIDMLQGDLPPELVDWLGQRPGVAVRKRRGTTFAYLGFNLEDPVVGERRVRRAIAHAIDRDAIIEHVMRGAARPASAVLPPDHWAGAPGLAPIRHDLERARALLDEAGYGPGRALRLVYKTSSDPFRVRLATILQDQLARAGVEVELKSYDWGTFYGDIKAGRFQMYSLAWVGIKMPDIFRYAFHSESLPPGGANRGRFRSERADRLIELAEAAGDLGTQARLYRALQAHLLEQIPYVPLWYEDQVFVARHDIEGYEVAADGNYDGLVTVRRAGRQ